MLVVHYAEDYDDNETTLCTQDLEELPTTLTTSDGTKVDINFGTTSSDGVSAYQPVAPSLHHMLEFALNYVNYSSGSDVKITEIGISSTSNGTHTSPNSNHFKNKAIDIYTINGTRIDEMIDQSLIQKLQDAFELCHNIRENFGPMYLHKNRNDYAVSAHDNHIHISSNTCDN